MSEGLEGQENSAVPAEKPAFNYAEEIRQLRAAMVKTLGSIESLSYAVSRCKSTDSQNAQMCNDVIRTMSDVKKLIVE